MKISRLRKLFRRSSANLAQSGYIMVCFAVMNSNGTFLVTLINSISVFCYPGFKSSAGFTCVGKAARGT